MVQENLQRVTLVKADTLISRFKDLGPSKFVGGTESGTARQWIQELEDIFEVMECNEIDKRKLAVFQLGGNARSWWELVKTTIGPEVLNTLTWEAFKTKFLQKYYSDTEQEIMQRAFMDLTQGSMTVTEYQNKFEELSHFAPHMIDTPERRARKFTLGLTSSIRRMLIADRRKSYENVVNEALCLEEDSRMYKIEMEKKNKARTAQDNHNSKGKQLWKKPRTENGNSSRSMTTEPPRRPRGPCYNCGAMGHIAMECKKPKVPRVNCYNCGEPGHISRDCKKPKTNGNPRQGAQARVFAVIPEQAGVEGTLSISNNHARVLFDRGATHSFISSLFANN